MNTYAAVVLAAGKGTRMRSTLPKGLHQVAGLPLLAHVLHAIEGIPSTSVFSTPDVVASSSSASLDSTVGARFIAPPRPIVVVGYGAAQIEKTFDERCLYALQEEQLGTGHAVLSAQKIVDALNPLPQTVLVCYGDTPLIS